MPNSNIPWISVKDRLPEPYERVIVYAYKINYGDIGDGKIFRNSYRYTSGGWSLSLWTSLDRWLVTHWCAITPPDEQEKESGE